MLELGCGTGLFMAACPEVIEGVVSFTVIEFDSVTARIAKLLYPRQWVRHEDFTKAKLPAGFDLAIGNPPFSSRTVNNPAFPHLKGFSLHDFFIARSVDVLRPGGLAASVMSRYTMDKSDSRARDYIASQADLLGEIRFQRRDR